MVRHRLIEIATLALCITVTAPNSANAQAPEGPEIAPNQALNFGSIGEDALASFALDPDGSYWVAGMQKGLRDGFTYDWFVAKLAADGKPQWARVYGSAMEDSTMRHIDMAGEGIPRMLALCPDGSGAIVVGRSEAGPDGKSPHAAIVSKVRPDGTLAWSKAFRPGWENKMIQSAGATGVAIHGKRAYVVGVTSAESMGLLAVYDTDSGALKSAQGFDPGPTYNDRLFGIAIDPAQKAIWVGGWSGEGNKGMVGRLTLEDKPKLEWWKRIPNGWASTVPDIALDAAGNAYLASEVHGARNWVEVWKLSPTGETVWRAKYDTQSNIETNNTHAIHVFGDKVVVLGRIGFGGTQTHSDRKFGDSLLLVLDLDANIVKQLYHFTGTAQGFWAMERSRGAALRGKSLYVAGNIWSEGANYKGQWRQPEDYKLRGVITKDAPPTEPAVVNVDDQTRWGTRDPSWLVWNDDTAKFSTGTPAENSQKKQLSTQGYIFRFDSLF